MNIIDALKSDRPFKRKHWTTWVTRYQLEQYRTDLYNNTNDVMVFMTATQQFPVSVGFDIEGILANDWEIKEAKFEITANQAAAALYQYHLAYGNENERLAAYYNVLGISLDDFKESKT